MNTLSEEDLILWIKNLNWPHQEFISLGIGDDCAICTPDSKHDLVVTTDLLVQDRHFLLATTSAMDLGWKIGAVNLSDIAAMGAMPVAFFLSAAFPVEQQEYFQEILKGLGAILNRYSLPLAGGDLSAGDGFYFSGTVIGKVPRNKSLLRKGAHPDDGIYVTGSPGRSSAGLRLLSMGYRKTGETSLSAPNGHDIQSECAETRRHCITKHLCPEPRIEVGQFLRESGVVTSAIDTSDGIARDLRQICTRSNVGAQIFKEAVDTLSDNEWVTIDDVLGGGEDYELLFTLHPDGEESFLHAYSLKSHFPPVHRIGRICAAHPREIRLLKDGVETELPVEGYDHFSALRIKS